MTEARDHCGCCDGTGTVLDMHGNRRPCSRCRNHDFDRWCDDRRVGVIRRDAQAGDNGGAAS